MCKLYISHPTGNCSFVHGSVAPRGCGSLKGSRGGEDTDLSTKPLPHHCLPFFLLLGCLLSRESSNWHSRKSGECSKGRSVIRTTVYLEQEWLRWRFEEGHFILLRHHSLTFSSLCTWIHLFFHLFSYFLIRKTRYSHFRGGGKAILNQEKGLYFESQEVFFANVILRII